MTKVTSAAVGSLLYIERSTIDRAKADRAGEHYGVYHNLQQSYTSRLFGGYSAYRRAPGGATPRANEGEEPIGAF